MNGFIVRLTQYLIEKLYCMTPFRFVERLITRYFSNWWGEGSVEVWAIAMLAFALTALIAGPVSVFVMPLIAWRIFEFIVYHAKLLLVDPHMTDDYKLHSYRRALILAGLNYVEMLFWFAAVYLNFADNFSMKEGSLTPNTAVRALYYSVITMTTLGYGDITPIAEPVQLIAITQTLVGVMLVLFILTRLINLLPKPGTRDPDESQTFQIRKKVTGVTFRRIPSTTNRNKTARENKGTRTH